MAVASLGHSAARAAEFSVTDWADFHAYQADNAQVQNTAPRDHRVVFMGDSITEFWDQDRRQIFADPRYINRGISGQTTHQMLLRFRQDVIALRPDYSGDGVHPNQAGYEVMAKLIKAALGK
ncbi:MAG TPA: hypothetical protein DCS63_06890 [Elusimicrobia bacterium]|nr:hypothetical protein [Elusimicrobiota bacterium]